MKRRPPLAPLFAELNATHFSGRLKPYRVRRLPARGAVARRKGKWWILGGYCRPLAGTITVRNISADFDRKALLHEMCHAATEDELLAGLDHGPEWRAEMLRLAVDHGEQWAAQHVAYYTARADAEAERRHAEDLERVRREWRQHAPQLFAV